jgi:ligand-binding sensor domain-containing protein
MKKQIFYVSLALSTLISCEDEDTKPVILTDLTNRSITALAFDNSSVLWVGTDTGLFKSVTTGYQLIDYKIDAPVTALAFEENSKTIWVGTSEGLAKLSLSGSASKISDDKLSNKIIRSVYVDGFSDKWFGTDTGITRNSAEVWQKEKFKKNASGTITDAAFENFGINSIGNWDGDYYFATNGNGLWRAFDWNESIDAFTGATQWDYPYNGTALTDTMTVAFIDSKGQQWFGGRSGIQVHTGHLPKEENISFYDELVNPIVTCVSEAPNGDIWVGTEMGISIFDGFIWTTLTASLPDNYITAIAFESNGNAWIGTKKGLVSID